MRRIILSFTFVMVLAIAGILFFQWNGFLSGSAEVSRISEVNQTFTIKHMGNGFFITQEVHFVSGNQKEMKIGWPENATNFECVDEDGDRCLSKEHGEFSIKVKEEENEKLTITYKLERQLAKGNLLLRDWYPVLSSAIPVKTTINIIEETARHAAWISGYKDSKHEEMDFIDYYSFNGSGLPSDLLLYSGELNLYEDERVRVYSKEKTNYNMGEAEYSDSGFVTVVIDDGIPAHETENLLIMGKDQSQSILMQKVNWGLKQQKYSASYQESWLKEFMASMIMKSPQGSPKALKVYQELENGLTVNQFAAFRQLLMEERSTMIQAGRMDVLLKQATNFTSSYITEMTKHKGKEIPFVLKASQTVILNGKPLNGADLIQYKRDELISMTEVLQAAGIEFKYLQEGIIYSIKGGNSYRFFIDKDYFIINEENYGLLTKPVQRIGGTVFMDVEWLEKLFKMEIERTSTNINIQTNET
ncbi:hypothetical protein [Rossellomorea sp. NS-SX7]|uniref:hypothetical protein n=1 Tax=Rossellomorea sp. NS-SX7 TaxID=3463856 RepID=UPI004058F18B